MHKCDCEMDMNKNKQLLYTIYSRLTELVDIFSKRVRNQITHKTREIIHRK